MATSLLLAITASGCHETATAPSISTPALDEPAFNLDVMLRPAWINHGYGYGRIAFRQPGPDGALTVRLGVVVRELDPNTTYLLQRAVDSNLDRMCTSTAWVTLGRGSQPQSVATDDNGVGHQDLFRNLTGAGSRFDIHFQLIREDNAYVVMTSPCYQFTVR